MPNAAAYRRFLEQFGLSADEVPPLMPGKDMARTLLRLKSNYESIPEEQRAVFTELLQGFEANSTNLLMQNMSRVLSSTIADLGLPWQCDTYTGIFPTNSFNAQATMVDGGALILIDIGCFSLIEALISLWAWEGDEQRKAYLACRFIRDYVVDYSLPNAAEYDHPSLRTKYRLLAFSDLISRAEEFVLAHEHAHIALGHLWQDTPKLFSTPVGSVPLVEKSVEQELDADQLASHILFSVKKDQLYWRQAGAAIYIVFGIARLIEKAVAVQHGQKFPQWDTHPPALVRGAWVEKTIASWGMIDYTDLGARFNAWITYCEDNFEGILSNGNRGRKSAIEAESGTREGTPRVGVYVRTNVITTKFDNHESLLLRYCAEQSWDNITVYRDNIGGMIDPSNLNQLELLAKQGRLDQKQHDMLMLLLTASENLDGRRQLLEDISLGKLDIVVVYEFDRLGRNRLEMFEVLSKIMDAKVRLFIPRIGEVNEKTPIPVGVQADYD